MLGVSPAEGTVDSSPVTRSRTLTNSGKLSLIKDWSNSVFTRIFHNYNNYLPENAAILIPTDRGVTASSSAHIGERKANP